MVSQPTKRADGLTEGRFTDEHTTKRTEKWTDMRTDSDISYHLSCIWHNRKLQRLLPSKLISFDRLELLTTRKKEIRYKRNYRHV